MSIAQNYPIVSPALSLDFANVQALDSRVTYARATTATYYGTRTAMAEQNLFLQSAVPYPLPWAWTNGYIGSLGSELVTNGNFSSATGWVGNTGIITGGVAAFVAVAGSIYQNILTVGKRYKLELVVSRFVAAGTFRVRLGGGGTGDLFLNITGTGTYTITGIASVNTTLELISYTTACDFDIDSVSVKESVQNFLTAPDGTSTASTLVADAANATFTQTATVSAGQVTFSVYLRRVTGTGDIQIQTGNGIFVTQTITSTWARYTDTQTVSAGARTWGVRIVTSGDQVEVWGAQLEARSVTAYTPTTTQPVTNYIPVLETAASNVARFDHNPTTFESLGLLIEEQRTNLQAYSEDFSATSSLNQNITVTNNVNISPTATLTAALIVENTATDQHRSLHFSSQSYTSGASFTASVYVKRASGTRNVVLRIDPGSATFGTLGTNYNLTTLVVTPTAGQTGTITAVGNSWYRLTITAAASVTASGSYGVGIWLSNGTTPSDITYTGDGNSGIFVWGAQLEAGAFATSYIPTVASQVTRAADSASMTGTNFSSWYNQAEGTIYGDCTYFGVNQTATKNLVYIATTSTNYLSLFSYAATTGAFVMVNGVTQAEMYTGNTSENANAKQILAYKVNDFATVRNGASAVVDGSGVLPVVNGLYIGGTSTTTSILNGRIKKIAYYPLRLTDTQLQALTG